MIYLHDAAMLEIAGLLGNLAHNYANGGYQVPPLPEALAYKTSGIALKGRCKS